MTKDKKEMFVFVDAHRPTKAGLTKTYDEIGWQRWDFTVADGNYGRIVCSFYPQQLEKTLYAYFGQQISGKKITNAKDVEAVDDKFPGVLLDQVEHALRVLESLLPGIIEQSLVLAGQKSIHLALWDLNDVTHVLGPKKKVADTFDSVLATADKMARQGVKNRLGRRGQITDRKIREAYRELGPTASQTALALALDVSDRQIRNRYHSGENYAAFRRRHTHRK